MKLLLKILKAIGGALLIFPLMVAAFFVDRVILIALPHVQGPRIKEIFDNMKYFIPIIYRVSFVAAALLLTWFFNWLFW